MKQSKKSGTKQHHRVRVVRGCAPDPSSTLSAEEQARVLALADVALRAGASDRGPAHVGDRARREHEQLKQELREVVDGFEHKRRSGAR